MNRLLFTSLLLLGCTSLPACAHQEALVDIQIQDIDSGGVLQRLPHAGRDYIAGQPGHRFAVTLQNLTGARVLAVLSVDGVNAISGQTASGSQSGYVLEPWQQVQVSGWRKSYQDVAEFYFTDLPDSYAARTGRADNVGVIGVAAFRERRIAPPIYAPMPQIDRAQQSPMPANARESGMAAQAKSADATAGASSPNSPRRDEIMAEQQLGTGHGQRRYDPVAQTTFERDSTRPNQIVSVYYDSWAALAARGVIAPQREYHGEPEPFPLGFVPDP